MCDFYPACERNLVLIVFSLMAPIGASLGFFIGAALGEGSWRACFAICGFPGIRLGALVLWIRDPPRGINDAAQAEKEAAATPPPVKKAWKIAQPLRQMTQDTWAICSNPHWFAAQVGFCFSMFAIGLSSVWIVTFLVDLGLPVGLASLGAGCATIIGGIGGTILGASVAERVSRRSSRGTGSDYLLVPALFTVPAAGLAAWITSGWLTSPVGLLIALICMETLRWTFIAPVYALSITVIPTHLKSRSSGLNIFFEHALGDMISPLIVGCISDASNLRNGMQLGWITILLSGVAWFLGWACLPSLPAFHRDGSPDGKGTSCFSLCCRSDVQSHQKEGEPKVQAQQDAADAVLPPCAPNEAPM